MNLQGFIRDLLRAGDWVAGDISQDELDRLLVAHGLAEMPDGRPAIPTKELLDFLGEDETTWRSK